MGPAALSSRLSKMPTVAEKRKIAQAILDRPSPELAECLVAWFYDDGCHLAYSLAHFAELSLASHMPCPPHTTSLASRGRYSVMLRAVGHLTSGKPKDSVEAIFYRRLHRLIICVDRMHFKNHLKTDKFCQSNCNPARITHTLSQSAAPPYSTEHTHTHSTPHTRP